MDRELMMYVLSGPVLAALAVISCLIPRTGPQAWRGGVIYTGIAVFLPVTIGLCCNIQPLLYMSIAYKAVVGMVAFTVAVGAIFMSMQRQSSWRRMTASLFLMAAGFADVISIYRIAKYSF